MRRRSALAAAVAAAAVAAVAAHAVRSAGKQRLTIRWMYWGHSDVAPVILRKRVYPRAGIAYNPGPRWGRGLFAAPGNDRLMGFVPMSLCLQEPPMRGFFVEGGRWSPFLFAKEQPGYARCLDATA